MARVLSRTTQPILGHGACRKQKGAAGVLLAVAPCEWLQRRQQRAEARRAGRLLRLVRGRDHGRARSSRRWEACTFRGYELSLVTFANNGVRNSYICSTCGFDVGTDAAAIEKAARRFGGRFVAGDRYLIKVPNAAAEQAVRDALG